ncbi:Thiol-disulfide oxidoreductase ResA [Anatilimnocola aggregata]|uniref:Thiol-disulfide oxidoreductase ResA n=1 Tax=Anatilimnocola aggregata TaxID=2528021 RepID=A0A517YLL2_9BACT|nr:TlpA disulfide reductase family protein [Anatilimnocola aggregata]QDU31088.1 Thiol-disulfide oxidoreductase ResA [Anatilimnocola aggregata]
MLRAVGSLALILCLSLAVWAQEKSPLERVQADPNDVTAWGAYWSENFRIILSQMQSDPKAALKQVDEIEATLTKHPPTSDEAKTSLTRMKASLTSLRASLAVAQMSFADLEKELTANPDDAKALANYTRKAVMEIGRQARSEPEKADEQLTAIKASLTKIKEAAKDDKTKETIDSTFKNFANIERAIAGSRKLEQLVGKDAAPLDVEAWVNGKPLTDADLKGKVVLLDFWAVWCGPCIATFPHLREWQEQYGDKGLVIIGMTRYYNFKWDEEAKKAARAKDEVSPAEENEMLVKFAEMHSLKHRFAIQESSAMSDFYAVSGIPHVVVIDQQGKIRTIKVGSGEENAKAISELLKTLLEEKKTSAVGVHEAKSDLEAVLKAQQERNIGSKPEQAKLKKLLENAEAKE